MPPEQRLPLVKANYLRGGMARVEGWLRPSAAFYLSSLEVLQRGLPLTGDVCEIGIHHGKSFLCLALGLPQSEQAVAIDVFEDQALNVDRSGRGNREAFERNLSEHGAGSNVEILQVSSLRLEARGFLQSGRRFRFFSIDGGHTPEATRNDLSLAERSIVDHGLVALDDVLNPHWLGVVTGLFDYWTAGGTLVPVSLLPGKLLLAGSAEQAQAYRRLMKEHFAAALDKSGVPLGTHEIDIYREYPWVVYDDAGRRGPLSGTAKSPAPMYDATGARPRQRIEAERQRARKPATSRLRRVARRIPGLAPAVRRARRTLARPLKRTRIVSRRE